MAFVAYTGYNLAFSRNDTLERYVCYLTTCEGVGVIFNPKTLQCYSISNSCIEEKTLVLSKLYTYGTRDFILKYVRAISTVMYIFCFNYFLRCTHYNLDLIV